eukprot:scaffold96_cov124-Isochrysis_galbana.AAC.2
MEERPRHLVGTTRHGARLHLHVHPHVPTHQSVRHKTEPPPFWAEAVKEFRGLTLNRINDSDANHRSQPLWSNPHDAPPPKMYHGYRTVWQALGTLTVDNII